MRRGALLFVTAPFFVAAPLVAVLVGFAAVGCGGTERGTIGAILGRRQDGRVFLRDVPAHLAAGQAELAVGDEILLVDGRDVRDLSDAELGRILEGNVGDPVQLTLVREGAVLRVTLPRSRAEPYPLRTKTDLP